MLMHRLLRTMRDQNTDANGTLPPSWFITVIYIFRSSRGLSPRLHPHRDESGRHRRMCGRRHHPLGPPPLPPFEMGDMPPRLLAGHRRLVLAVLLMLLSLLLLLPLMGPWCSREMRRPREDGKKNMRSGSAGGRTSKERGWRMQQNRALERCMK